MLGQIWVLGRLVESLFKFVKVGVVHTILNMEGQGQVIESGLARRVIENLHVVKQSLLVRQVKVVLLVVGRSLAMTRRILRVALVFRLGRGDQTS